MTVIFLPSYVHLYDSAHTPICTCNTDPNPNITQQLNSPLVTCDDMTLERADWHLFFHGNQVDNHYAMNFSRIPLVLLCRFRLALLWALSQKCT